VLKLRVIEGGMAMSFYFENLKDGYSRRDTILTFGLENWQLDLLKEVTKIKEIKGRQLKIFTAVDFTDIIAIPYFMAFLNFAQVSESDRQTFFDFWKDIWMPVTYILNCNNDQKQNTPYLYLENDIFEDKSKLRLVILHEIKELEGKGWMATQNSQRMIRVLSMYKQLKTSGWITRNFCIDISDRTFKRDLEVIRSIGETVGWNNDTKRYELDFDTYTHNRYGFYY
jgi:hypothetical protein